MVPVMTKLFLYVFGEYWSLSSYLLFHGYKMAAKAPDITSVSKIGRRREEDREQCWLLFLFQSKGLPQDDSASSMPERKSASNFKVSSVNII